MYSHNFKKVLLLIGISFLAFMGGALLTKDKAISVSVSKSTKKVEMESRKVNGRSVNFYHPTNGGIVTSAYGKRWGKMHKGMDISRELGTDVVACLDGTVKSRFYEKDGYGNVVIIDHGNGVESRYAHLNSFNVKIGDKVKAGNKIASVGSTGRSTGPHLHFEVRINNKPVNPDNYI